MTTKGSVYLIGSMEGTAAATMIERALREWPDEAEAGAPFDGGKLVQCTDVAEDLAVDCHGEADDWNELRLVAQMLDAQPTRTHGSKKTRLRGIPTRGGLVVGPEGELEIV